MKNVFSKVFVLLVSVAALGVLAANVYAENAPQTIATVNIYNAKVDSQSGNVFNLSFDISNRVGVQPNVKYSVILSTSTSTTKTVFDEYVYDDVLSLGENSSVHKKITYVAPATLSGTYELLISSKNENGFPFALASIGKVTLVAKTQGVQINNDSCYLTIQGEKGLPHYTLLQGVDVLSSEVLLANCKVVNNTTSAITIVPKFETKNRNAFGSVAAQEKSSLGSVTLNAKEVKTISLQIPKALSPQAYNAELVFLDAQNKPISNEVSFHYVIRGISATIQQAVFDKDQYVVGDTAHISLIVSGASDVFTGSRIATPTALGKATVEYSITGDAGACSGVVTNDFTLSKMEISAPVIKDCVNPTLVVNIKNNGSVLAQKDFAVTTQKSNQEMISDFSSQPYILVLFVGLVVIALCVLLLKRRSAMLSVFLLVLCGGLFMFSGSAKADTIVFGADGNPEAYGVINFNKSSYAPNENVVLSGEVQNVSCSNLFMHVKIALSDITSSTTPPYSEPYISYPWPTYSANYNRDFLNGSSASATYTFVAPSTPNPGTYYIYTRNQFYNTPNYKNATLPFTVTAPVGNVTISATSIVCDSEADIPNDGASNNHTSSPTNASTASNFLASHPNCRQVPWNFYWTPTAAQGIGWAPFTTNGVINNTVTAPIPSSGNIGVSEEIRSGYIPFTGGTSNNVSAYLECAYDGLMYDNVDIAYWLVPNTTYYCVSYNAPVTPPVVAVAPTCSSAAPEASVTTATSGSFYVYAYGVSSDTVEVKFHTFGSTGGTDDFVMYSGTNLGGGTWRAAIDLGNHKAGNPEYGTINSDARLYSPGFSDSWCGQAGFTRNPATPTSVNFSANPTNIAKGSSATLSWSSNVSACTGTNFDTGGLSSGSVTVTPDATTTYTVTCNGQAQSVTVTVQKKPTFIEN